MNSSLSIFAPYNIYIVCWSIIHKNIRWMVIYNEPSRSGSSEIVFYKKNYCLKIFSYVRRYPINFEVIVFLIF